MRGLGCAFFFFGFHFILPLKNRLCVSLALYFAAFFAAVVVIGEVVLWFITGCVALIGEGLVLVL